MAVHGGLSVNDTKYTYFDPEEYRALRELQVCLLTMRGVASASRL